MPHHLWCGVVRSVSPERRKALFCRTRKPLPFLDVLLSLWREALFLEQESLPFSCCAAVLRSKYRLPSNTMALITAGCSCQSGGGAAGCGQGGRGPDDGPDEGGPGPPQGAPSCHKRAPFAAAAAGTAPPSTFAPSTARRLQPCNRRPALLSRAPSHRHVQLFSFVHAKTTER